MRRRVRRYAWITCLPFWLGAAATSAPARADDRVAEAAIHFHRGVDLYDQSDFMGALVELQRAYTIAPAVNLLFNIGQTEYQLQHYAEALRVFEQYVHDGGTAHKADVDAAIDVLRARVGRIRLVANAPGADVQIDDRPAGRTPLADPLRVSIGRRKVAVTPAGGTPITQWVDVASGEEVTVTFDLPRAVDPRPAADHPSPLPEAAPDRRARSGVPVAAWVVTGALGAGTIVTGILALESENRLDSARNAYPGNPSDISQRESTTRALAVTADLLGVGTAIVAGLSLYWTLSRPAATGEWRAAVGPAGVTVAGAF